VTTNTLHGLEGLRAALECPKEWEARWSSGYVKSTTWTAWPLSSLIKSSFRRVEKPREARTFVRRVALHSHTTVEFRNSHERGVSLTLWLPSDIDGADLTIREVVPVP
jgi:hypothetical protein